MSIPSLKLRQGVWHTNVEQTREQRGTTPGFESTVSEGSQVSTRFDAGSRSGSGRNRATDASQSGFNLLSLTDWAKQSKKALTISVLAFSMLFPPTVGQIVNPGIPQGSSVVTEQVQQAKSLPTAEALGAAMQQARSRVPQQGTGAARESMIRDVIGVYESHVTKAGQLDQVSGSAQREVEGLREGVSWDAKAGKAVDLYWFGISSQNADYHASNSDSKTVGQQGQELRTALTQARSGAREEVSNLLIAESRPYAELHANYTQVKAKYETAVRVSQLAQKAESELSGAEWAIMMRNSTPDTKQEEVKDAEGHVTGYQNVPNPDYATYETMAIIRKASAEQAVRTLNAEVSQAQSVLGLDAQVDANLINVLDFIGQPSLGLWSFDASDVSQTKAEVARLDGMLQGVADAVKPTLDKLQGQVDQQIDARWNQINARVRRRDDGVEEWS